MIDIYIVNMKNSIERKKNISLQLENLNIPFKIFEAVDGRVKPEHPLMKMYSSKLSFKYKGQYLSPGQLGCYASHYLLWQKCIQLNKNILVIEDDAKIFDEPFLSFINNIETIPEHIDCIRLFENKRPHFTSKFDCKCGDVEIHRFSRGHMSTTSYYLTPNGARKLLEKSNQWFLPVDIYMDRFWVNNLICYGTVPICVTNDKKFDSDIGYVKKKKLTARGKINREIFNASETVKRAIFNIVT